MDSEIGELTDQHSAPEKRGFSRWISGRARRREYWLWIVGAFVSGFLVAVGRGSNQGAVSLAFGLPILAGLIRRLHDLDRSGWWALLLHLMTSVLGWAAGYLLTPIAEVAGAIIYLVAIIVIGVLPGSLQENRFGPPPARRRSTEPATEQR